MQTNHEFEKQQFLKLFKQEGIDSFDERFLILEVFLQTEKHITVDELVALVKEQNSDIDQGVIVDTVELLCRFGFAQKVKFEGGPVRYEHRHIGHHHDHMICTKCRKIVEFENDQLENIQSNIAASHGFHILQHKLELYGICTECTGKRTGLVPLSQGKSGENFIIRDFIGGSRMRSRLASMGLNIGDKIEVLTCCGNGQVVVASDSRRFSLGKGLSGKIMVLPDVKRPAVLPSSEEELNLNKTKQGDNGDLEKVGRKSMLRHRFLGMGIPWQRKKG